MLESAATWKCCRPVKIALLSFLFIILYWGRKAQLEGVKHLLCALQKCVGDWA